MTDPDLSRFRPLVAEASRAFRLDPRYCIDIARAAVHSHATRSRRAAAKREREERAASTD